MASGGAAAGALHSSSDNLPVVGACWREKYEVLAQLDDLSGAKQWRARSVSTGERVRISAFVPRDPALRQHVWKKLETIQSAYLPPVREVVNTSDLRLEVVSEPGTLSLREWRAARTTPDAATLKTLVTHLTEAIGILHALELVHLSVSPDTVRVAETGADVVFSLGSLECVTSFDRNEPIPARVNPLYAPPEAAGLQVHAPGPGICGWDLWSIGRVLQHAILGHHVFATVLPAGQSEDELATSAEALLYEADPQAPRAGAVEKMPGLDPNVGVLLRGLLTTSKEARWTRDNIDRWLRGLPVKEQYTTPRAQTHFRWRGRPSTVAEVATFLQSAEHWAANASELFEPEKPGTLANFLRGSPSQSLAYEQLKATLELADALPLKLASPAAQKEAMTIFALVQLSAATLRWRGQGLDSATIGGMMDSLGEVDAMAVLRALSTRSTALQIERIDQAAGRQLTELGKVVGDAEGMLRRNGFLAANDVSGTARLFRLALEPIASLRSVRESLVAGYAGSDHAAVDKLFKSQTGSRSELVVLAWMAPTPERFKFYTHLEADRRRAEGLRKRAGELISALTWVQLERALAVGRGTLAGWGLFVLLWLLIGMPAILLWPGTPGAGYALIPFVVALAFRLLAAPQIRRELRTLLPAADWSWRDAPTRCRRELRLAAGNVGAAALETELVSIRGDLAKLEHVQQGQAPVPELPRFPRVRLLGALSWSLIVLFAGVAVWRMQVQPPSLAAVKKAWIPSPEELQAEARAKAAAAAAAAKAKSEGEDVRIIWPYKPGEYAAKLSVRSTQAASSAQLNYANTHGRELVQPYRRDTISTLIIMPVPSENDMGVMLFDGKNGQVVNEQVYLLDFKPIPRSWVELAGRKGVFLDM